MPALTQTSRRLAAFMTMRLDARVACGAVSRESLCNAIDEYVQRTKRKTGEVEGRNSANRGGAPLGNQNRFKHGRRAREIVFMRAEVRRFVHRTNDLCEGLKLAHQAAQSGHAHPLRRLR